MSKILIVDDDNYLRGLYASVFQEAGFTVIEAGDGAKGLDLAKSNKPDIIFTGTMMPNLTGFEMMKRLKADQATATIPVMISSHLGRDEDRVEAEHLGAKAFLVKGLVSPRQVVNLVLKLLNTKVFEKVFQVELSPQKFDAGKLQQELHVPGPIVLELTPGLSGVEGSFIARVVYEAKLRAPGQKSGDDLSGILRDIESKLKG